MRVIRIFLLVFISFWILLMAGCPGMYDSKRTFTAFHHYYDSPSKETQRELDEAHRLDRRDILIYESVMAIVLGGAIYGFIRAGRKVS
jgi:hypothetical protein